MRRGDGPGEIAWRRTGSPGLKALGQTMTQPRIKSGVPTGPGSMIPAMPETISRTPISWETARLLSISRVSDKGGGPASPVSPAGLPLFSDECNFPSSRVTRLSQDSSRGGDAGSTVCCVSCVEGKHKNSAPIKNCDGSAARPSRRRLSLVADGAQ